jgi:hypothetical protein
MIHIFPVGELIRRKYSLMAAIRGELDYSWAKHSSKGTPPTIACAYLVFNSPSFRFTFSATRRDCGGHRTIVHVQ